MPGFAAIHQRCSYMREYLGKYPEKCCPKGLHFCIRKNVLREFLIRRRGEVTKVTQLDYTFDRSIELAREDTRKEERVNTKRERIAKEQARQAKEKAEKEVERRAN